MTQFKEVPSIEDIEAVERLRLQAEQSLEISNGFVKCQGCGRSLKLFPTHTTKTTNVRIERMENRLKRIALQRRHKERYYTGSRPVSHIENDTKEEIELKQALAAQRENDAKAEQLRRIPLYSSPVSDYKFVCSRCFQKLYILVHGQRDKLID